MNAHVVHNNFHVESQCDIPDVDCSRAEIAALLISHDHGRHTSSSANAAPDVLTEH
jgi:hypothetical protein